MPKSITYLCSVEVINASRYRSIEHLREVFLCNHISCRTRDVESPVYGSRHAHLLPLEICYCIPAEGPPKLWTQYPLLILAVRCRQG